jgi:hypothetical protein
VKVKVKYDTISQQAVVHPWLAADAHVKKGKVTPLKVAQRGGGTGIALLFHDLRTRRG